jgi:hypothetical protein
VVIENVPEKILRVIVSVADFSRKSVKPVGNVECWVAFFMQILDIAIALDVKDFPIE